MKKNMLSTIVGVLAVMLLSGSFAVAGEYFDLQQGDGDRAVPGRDGLTSRGDLAGLSRGTDLIAGDGSRSLSGRVLQRRSRQLFQTKPRPKSASGGVIFQGSRPRIVCAFAYHGVPMMCMSF